MPWTTSVSRYHFQLMMSAMSSAPLRRALPRWRFLPAWRM